MRPLDERLMMVPGREGGEEGAGDSSGVSAIGVPFCRMAHGEPRVGVPAVDKFGPLIASLEGIDEDRVISQSPPVASSQDFTSDNVEALKYCWARTSGGEFL